MKNTIIQIVKLVFVSAMITGCAFDKNDPSAERAKEREEDRSKLTQQLKPVEGVYIGKLEFFDRPSQLNVDVELGLILEEENAGVDSDGLPIVRPALRAYFKRADDSNLGLVFKANYNTFIDPDKQNLILTNPSVLGAKATGAASGVTGEKAAGGIIKVAGEATGGQNDQEITSVRGKLENETITAEVLTGAGVLGKISLKLRDKSTRASSMGLQSDINEKMLRLYKRIKGTYEGSVNIGRTLNPVQIRVTLDAVAAANGKPVLTAYYERLDVYPLTDFNQELAVDYKTESYPQKITLAGASGIGFNFAGKIYSAQEVTHINCASNYADKECEFYLEGEVILTKNISSPVKLVRIKDRYQPKNAQVIGSYSGALDFADNRTATKLEVSLFVQDEVGSIDANRQPVRRQVMKAYVRRLDSYTGSTFSVSYNDILNSDSYNLILFSPVSPGFEFQSIRGTMKNGMFQAEVLSVNGVVGTAELKWINGRTQAPRNGVDNDANEQLFKIYNQIKGTYAGKVNYGDSEMPPYTAKFVVSVIKTATGKPMLRAFYTRSDDTAGVLSLDMDVDYKPEMSPPSIVMTTAGAGGGNGGVSGVVGRTYLLNIEGHLLPRDESMTADKCKIKENVNSSACRPVIVGTLSAPKGRTSAVKLVKATN